MDTSGAGLKEEALNHQAVYTARLNHVHARKQTLVFRAPLFVLGSGHSRVSGRHKGKTRQPSPTAARPPHLFMGHPAMPSRLHPLRPSAHVCTLATAAFAVFFAPVFSTPAAAQHGPLVSHTHWSYDFLEALDLVGGASAWMPGVRPVSRGVVTAELDRVALYGLFGPAPHLLAPWRHRLTAESTPLAIEAGTRSGEAYVDPGTGTYIAPRGELTFNPGFQSVGPFLSGPISIWGEATFGGYTHFEGVRDAGISVPLGAFTLSALRQPYMGGGPASASAVYGGEIPLDLVALSSRRLVSLPGLDWLFGHGEGQIAFGPFGGIQNLDQGWVGQMMLRSRPHPRFRVGVTRAVHFGRSEAVDPFAGKPVTFDRLNRMIFMRMNTPHDWDDQKAELSLELRTNPKGLPPIAPYLVLSMEDGPIYLDPGIHAGVRTAALTPQGLFMFRYEYAAIGERARWCRICDRVTHNELGQGFSESGRDAGPWYWHGAVRWPYARDGVPMGEPLGGYGARHRIDAWVFPLGAEWRLRAWAFEERRERWNLLEDRWMGIRRGVGAEGAIQLFSPAFEVVGDAMRAGPEWGVRLGLKARFGSPGPARTDGATAQAALNMLTLQSLAPGTRVQVTSPALLYHRASGTLVGVELTEGIETLRFTDRRGVTRSVPVTRLRVSPPPTGGSSVGALRGAVAGLVLGFVAGIFADEETRSSPDEIRFGIRGGGAALGALTGGAIGWRIPLHRWEEVELR